MKVVQRLSCVSATFKDLDPGELFSFPSHPDAIYMKCANSYLADLQLGLSMFYDKPDEIVIHHPNVTIIVAQTQT